jgi:hypothetical protein
MPAEPGANSVRRARRTAGSGSDEEDPCTDADPNDPMCGMQNPGPVGSCRSVTHGWVAARRACSSSPGDAQGHSMADMDADHAALVADRRVARDVLGFVDRPAVQPELGGHVA